MKVYFSLIPLMFLLTMTGNAQWEWSHPCPQGNELYCIGFTDPRNGFAMGSYGAIVRTPDSGESWDLIENPVKCKLYKFHFPSPTVGYAIGQDMNPSKGSTLRVILKTTDGGNHWFTIFHDPATRFHSLWFTSESTGFTVGDLGIIRKTTDGGMTWENFYSSTEGDLNDIAFFDSLTGIATGESGVMVRSNDGGKSWNPVNGLPFAKLTSLHITSSSSAHLALLGELPFSEEYRHTVNLLETNDAGLTWQVSPDSLKLKSIDYIVSVDFPTRDTGYVALLSDKLVRTTDAGGSWDTVPLDLFPGRIHFIDGMTGFALRGEIDAAAYAHGGIDSQIWKTTDRGLTWNLTTEQASIAHFRNIEFPSSAVGYAVGGIPSGDWVGDIIKTTDGGAHWFRPMTDPLEDTYLYTSFFLNEDMGYAGGYNGKLFKTINGGVDWTTLLTDEHLAVSSIFFRDADTGYVTSGYNYGSEPFCALYITTNGGASWNTKTFPGLNLMTSIVFPSADTGYFVGRITGANLESSIYRSTTYGQTWEKIVKSTNDFFIKLRFFNASFGYALTYCCLYKTWDGGDHWSADTVDGSTSYLLDMNFLNPDTGYVVGDLGQIFRTTDGGKSWSKQESGTHFLLSSVCFPSPGRVFVAGHYSVILSGDNTSGLGIDKVPPKDPSLLLNCYPNPAMDNLSISFKLPNSGNVSIKIFDRLGKQVRFYSFMKQAPGKHIISIDTGSLQAGLYFCSILSNEICETRKVIVME